jgi:microcystin-dependent protein
MSNQYVGEIRLFPYSRGAPDSWQLCDGTLLPISQYEVLYTLIGTTYGGNGVSTFAVPDLRGRVPIHNGTGLGLSPYVAGQMAGTESVLLTQSQMASHFHVLIASAAAGNSTAPTGNLLATVPNEPFYATVEQGMSTYQFPATTIGMDGNNLPHDNTAPTLALNYCIALYGIFPSQG